MCVTPASIEAVTRIELQILCGAVHRLSSKAETNLSNFPRLSRSQWFISCGRDQAVIQWCFMIKQNDRSGQFRQSHYPACAWGWDAAHLPASHSYAPQPMGVAPKMGVDDALCLRGASDQSLEEAFKLATGAAGAAVVRTGKVCFCLSVCRRLQVSSTRFEASCSRFRASRPTS